MEDILINSELDVVNAINDVLKDNNKSMKELADHSGLKRESLYKILSPNKTGSMKLNTLRALMKSCGFTLSCTKIKSDDEE